MEESTKRKAAINRALYALTNLWSSLKQFHTTIIEPAKATKGGWLSMGVDPAAWSTLVKLDPDALYFLLEHDPALFAKIMIEQERFDKLHDYINVRNRFMLEIVWPRLTEAGLHQGALVSLQAAVAALDASQVRQAEMLASSIIEFSEQNLASLSSAFEALRAAGKTLFPDATFLQWRPA